MDFTSIKFRPYKYKIESFILTIPGLGDYNVDPKYITKIVIEKNYDRYIYPYFEVTMNVPNNVYRAAQKENIPFDVLATRRFTSLKRSNNN